MVSAQLLVALLGASGTARCTPVNNAAKEHCLDSDLVQSGSFYTGQEEGTLGINPGQSESMTDTANFINFCAGHELTNGKQNPAGSCNGIPMGKLPAQKNMISSIITRPQPGDRLPADTAFNVSVRVRGLRAGFLANPTSNYYTAPQELDEEGRIIGHCHITIQDIGDLRAAAAPDPAKFAYFRGIDDAVDENGLLQTVVEGGLAKGVYRLCTMIAARNHQPVTMPVAQRGAQDDCTKFDVVDEGEGHAEAEGRRKEST